jgi:hypothetical protein
MITISTPCSFASYDSSTKRLTSSIVTIGENTTIISGADAVAVNNDVMFCDCRENLVTQLKAAGVKESDGTEIIEETP